MVTSEDHVPLTLGGFLSNKVEGHLSRIVFFVSVNPPLVSR